MFGRDEKVSHARLTAVQYIILGIFFLLAYGLWRLQVAQSDLYSSLAEKNRVRNVPILAPRGSWGIFVPLSGHKRSSLTSPRRARKELVER